MRGGFQPHAGDPENRKAIPRLLSYLLRYRGPLVAAIILMVINSICVGILMLLVGMGTDVITNNQGIAALRHVILLILLDGAVLFIAGHFALKTLATITQKSLFDLRTGLFDHFQDLSLAFFDRQPIGELMSRLSNDVDVIDQFYSNGIQQTLSAVIMVIIATILMLLTSVPLTVLAYIAVFCLVSVSFLITRVAGPAFEHLQEQLAELNGYAEERISGQKVIISYGQKNRVTGDFSGLSEQVARIAGRAEFVAMATLPAASVIATFQTVLVLIIGGWMVIQGNLSFGTLIAFIGLSNLLSTPLSQIFSLYAQLMNAAAGASRVFAIMDEHSSVPDLPDAPAMPQVGGDVQFDHVTFAYVPGRTVLFDNSFHAKKSQLFGLCGPTGAGKSTIINILTRYYDIASGKITVDGTLISSVKQDTLRIQIAQVLQEPFLFSATIMENLRYARAGATDEECMTAAKQAGAHDFIMAQPHGYQTFLFDGGSNLSQGQRQMLTIARAIVAQPRMLILDEATSSVDTRTEKLIQAGLLSLQQGKTSFVIAHRLSTIRNADCILVINAGAIIESGTHTELMEKKGFYYTLFMSQFRGRLEGIAGAGMGAV